jgi:arginyl-tRNA synthetase
MIEYSNANTHKEYHVGHLRNICFGDAVNKILSANGFKSLPVSYINDFGIHVAKTIWWTFNKENENSPMLSDKNLDKGYFLGQMYVRACEEIKARDSANEEVGEVMKKIENRQGQDYKLWQKTRQWSITQFANIYKELGINFLHIFYESEYIDKGKDIVANLYEKRIFEKSQGAVIANLEKYNLGVLMILRTDGTALYPVADLALALEKFKKYKIDKSIYVVDIRQELYFKQLFKVLELLGIKKAMAHLVYDFVKLPSGMMSSRTGNVITYKELKKELFTKAKAETASRHEDWNEAKLNKTADKITIGAIKFEMLKVSASQVITFDIEQALRFDGFTAAYLQYTGARINSIIRKANSTRHEPHNTQHTTADMPEVDVEKKERLLILAISKFPEAVRKAGAEYDPSAIAKYLIELARDFNDYYHSVPVLQTELKNREARLKLITAVKQAIGNGLNLLGVEVLEEM